MTNLPLVSINRSRFLDRFFANPTELFPHAHASGKPPADPVVVTGQQVGLLGGPLYTLLKIRSAVQEAQSRSQEWNTHVQPVFWLEDNDHDAVEASTAWIPVDDGSLDKRVLSDGDDRAPVSGLVFTESDVERITSWAATFTGQHAAEVQQSVGTIYQAGRTWADAFLDVLDPYLKAWDVRVVRASEVIAAGSHAELVRRDLQSTELITAISAASERLTNNGFPLQAAVPETLFFLHVDGKRQRLHRTAAGFTTADGASWSMADLLTILDTDPARFTPNVMGRPLVQDQCMNTVAMVLGAAELAYHAQLCDVYPILGMAQPEPLVRHHALVIDPKTERLLNKLDMSAADLLHPWQEVEAHAVADTVEAALDGLESPEDVEALLAPYLQAAAETDATLVKSVKAAQASIEQTLAGIRGKLKTAVKRSQSERLDRLFAAWWMIYPHATLSERIIPLALWHARIGTNALRIIVETVCRQQSTDLTIIGVSSTSNN